MSRRFEPIERPTCHADNPVACPERRAEMRRGQFFYLWGIGWLWLLSKDVGLPWARCPWCDGKLPVMELALLRALREDR